MLPTAKFYRIALFWLALCCILVALSLPSLAFHPEAKTTKYTAISYDVFFEDTPTATIEQIANSQFRSIFSPLESTPVPFSVKTVWTRITIPESHMDEWKTKGLFPSLAFGGKIKRPATLFYKENPTDPNWRSLQVPCYRMPLPVSLPSSTTRFYLRIEGRPDFWFFPEISVTDKAKAPTNGPTVYWMLIGLMVGIAGINLFLAIFSKTESCFWLCIYSILTATYYTQSIAPSPTHGLNFSTAWGILLPGLALIILPHIGRNLFSRTSCPKHIDALLWGMSLLGVVFAIIPLIPKLGSFIYFLPLWPLAALLGAIPGTLAIANRIPGGKRFTAGCILTGLGGVLALQPIMHAEHAALLQLLPFAGVACGLFVLTPIALHNSEQTWSSPTPNRSIHSKTVVTEDAASPLVSPEKIIHKISHDLNSPLVTITRMSEKLNNTLVSAEGHESLRTLQAATHVLQLQLNDLLDLNRADSNRLILKEQEFNLQRLIKDAYHIMMPHAEEKGLSLSWKMAPNLPLQFIGDPGRLIQILLNLLGNAIRFSDTGEVSISLSALSPEIKNGQLLIKVKDQGRGIPVQNQYDVLDRFCQASEQGSGTYRGAGLGLSVACELVHLMGGFMCIESEPDTGTTISFTVKLDLAQPRKGLATLEDNLLPAEPQHDTCENDPAQPDSTENDIVDVPQILITETREKPCEILPNLLSNYPLTVHEVNTLEMAHTIYKALALDAVIVATDTHSEVEALISSLKDADETTGDSTTPIIAIATRPSHSTDLITAGASEVIESPISDSALIATLSKLNLVDAESDPPPATPDIPEASGTKNSPDSESKEETQTIEPHFVMDDEVEPQEIEQAETHPEPDSTVEEDEGTSSTIKLAAESDEEGQTIFDRIAQERRDEEDAEGDISNDTPQTLLGVEEVTQSEESDDPIGAPLKDAVSHFTLHTDEATHPAEVLDMLLLPKIPKIISHMQETYEELCHQSELECISGVLNAAEKLQHQAQKYALREVQKTASCVERAAQAQDNTAIQNLMVELETVVIQTGKALRDVYRLGSTLPEKTGEVE